jgi:hypothetical protein
MFVFPRRDVRLSRFQIVCRAAEKQSKTNQRRLLQTGHPLPGIYVQAGLSASSAPKCMARIFITHLCGFEVFIADASVLEIQLISRRTPAPH